MGGCPILRSCPSRPSLRISSAVPAPVPSRREPGAGQAGHGEQEAARPPAMSDVGQQGPLVDRGEPDRLTVLAFAAVILLGGLNGIAAKQILRELEPFWGGVLRF